MSSQASHSFPGRVHGKRLASLGAVGLAFLLSLSGVVGAEEILQASEASLVLKQGLVLLSSGRSGRNPFRTDAVEAAMVSGKWVAPQSGDSLVLADGTEQKWETTLATADGSFTNQPSTRRESIYIYVVVKADVEQIRILEPSGHSMVYVNGEPRVGDPYQNGTVQLPVLLRAGLNEFLFQVGRANALKAKLVTPKSPVMFNLRDTTLPDFIEGEKLDSWGAVIVVNATTNAVAGLRLKLSGQGHGTAETPLPKLLPLSTRKVAFPLTGLSLGPSNKLEFALELGPTSSTAGTSLDTAKLALSVRRPDQTHKQTFVSDIDGSVQYFAVTPAQPLSPDRPARALFLSVHGASVEGLGQAQAYSAKSWGHVVAPTNRRPYGFDWEDWGRHDAMEVLKLAMAKYGTDPRQVYLTGHSMGGHGTWQLGVTYPDRFAAIAPSAGWISFWSYAGSKRDETPSAVQALVQRAATPSDTLMLASNYLHHGVYILHGDADDNVPVSEARKMKEELSKFHHDFMYHEQPGAGHWWGNACVDWPPIFDFFARHKIPDDESVFDINFSTANPRISSSSHWLSIEAQEHSLAKSAVAIRYEPQARRFSGVTENVTRLAFAVRHVKPGGTLSVNLDGQKIEKIPLPEKEPKIWLSRIDGKWQPIDKPSPALKGPHRSGPFKEAFYHRMLFVYATQGTPEENAWAFAKARFDAEGFWYRGNGSIEVVPDVEFNAAREPDRGVILYGNADNNAAWQSLLSGSPVQVGRGAVRIEGREQRGEDLACLFLRPRPGSDQACVGVVSGTGIVGLKLTDRMPYFLAGVAYPDCTVFGLDALSKASAGVAVAGFFGEDWSVARGEFAWRDKTSPIK